MHYVSINGGQYEGARIIYRMKLSGLCTNVDAIKNTSSFVDAVLLSQLIQQTNFKTNMILDRVTACFCIETSNSHFD